MLSDHETHELVVWARTDGRELTGPGWRTLQLVEDHRALKSAVLKAMNQVGNLRVLCPELAALANAKEE